MNTREGREPQKYLRESYYHRIKWTKATFLVAFMWRRPLNNIALTTTTYRKPKNVSDGTGTQIRAQMINKCSINMAQRELYNVRDSPWGRDRKNWERILLQSKLYSYPIVIDLYKNIYIPPRTINSFGSIFLVPTLSSFESMLAVVKFIRT